MKLFPALLTLASFAFAAPAAAEVLAATPGGITTSNTATVTATPAQVWAALVEPARYWSPAHSWSGDAANMTLDPRAGGCFCEALPASGGSVEHMRVIHAAPGEMLRLSGALGPLQSEALAGTLTVTLSPVNDGTRIEWTYLVGGHARFDLVQLAPVVDGVMAEQLRRLAELLGPMDAQEE